MQALQQPIALQKIIRVEEKHLFRLAHYLHDLELFNLNTVALQEMDRY